MSNASRWIITKSKRPLLAIGRRVRFKRTMRCGDAWVERGAEGVVSAVFPQLRIDVSSEPRLGNVGLHRKLDAELDFEVLQTRVPPASVHPADLDVQRCPSSCPPSY